MGMLNEMMNAAQATLQSGWFVAEELESEQQKPNLHGNPSSRPSVGQQEQPSTDPSNAAC